MLEARASVADTLSALGKVIHNACKFTDKGYIHISMQDTSQDVVLPSGYDNSVKLSKVTIDIKDTGCGSESRLVILIAI